MLFYEDTNINYVVQARYSKACTPWGPSSICNMQPRVQQLVRLQQAILQPCTLYDSEVWAPIAIDAGNVPLWELQSLQHSFLRRAFHVKSSVSIELISEERKLVG